MAEVKKYALCTLKNIAVRNEIKATATYNKCIILVDELPPNAIRIAGNVDWCSGHCEQDCTGAI